MKVKPANKRGKVVVELYGKDDSLLDRTVAQQASTLMPFRIRRILVPIDFSECSKKALLYALAFAGHFKASVTLLHVIHINHAIGEYAGIDSVRLEKDWREGALAKLTELAKGEIQAKASVDALVRTGLPVREIVAAARQLESDLIIISTHGRTGLKHVILGSTTENVVRHAPCPVLTVRENEHEFITT